MPINRKNEHHVACTPLEKQTDEGGDDAERRRHPAGALVPDEPGAGWREKGRRRPAGGTKAFEGKAIRSKEKGPS